jgi:hypothetical protein
MISIYRLCCFILLTNSLFDVTRFNRLFLIKKFANKATTDYMNAREVRYLCRVGSNDLVQFGKLLIVAKSCGLVLGKVVTTSSSFYSRVISASKGDVVLELVGKLTTNKEALLKAIDTPSLFSVEAVLASSQDIDVRNTLTSFTNLPAFYTPSIAILGCLSQLWTGFF